MTDVPTLAVENLKTHFFTRAGVVKAVDGVDFTVGAGRIMALVGESGSGKTMTGFSILGLVDAPGRIVAGRILFNGQDLRTLPPEELRDIRGNRISMIFQDPSMALNPVLRIDTQMVETVMAHRTRGDKCSKAAALALAREALVRVGIAAPDERLRAYPHQFSGGMRQRVAIAIALLNRPDLIICDEPTTALDVTIQGQILAEMQQLCAESGTALIWITHDIALASGLADTVSVMYAGRIVEQGSVEQVLLTPRHPYTAGLIASTPTARPSADRRQPLMQIPGNAPSLLDLPEGCPFRPRCSRATEVCLQEPPMFVEDGQGFRCFHPLDGSSIMRKGNQSIYKRPDKGVIG